MLGRGEGIRDGDQLFIDALAHPIRRKILRHARSRGVEVSPAEMSRRLGEDIPKLSYHVRYLAEFKILKLSYTRQVRGATAHFYVLDPAAAQHPIVIALLAGAPPAPVAEVRGF